ncbi:MAG: hypothetical protein ABIG84_02110 [archaeon]
MHTYKSCLENGRYSFLTEGTVVPDTDLEEKLKECPEYLKSDFDPQDGRYRLTGHGYSILISNYPGEDYLSFRVIAPSEEKADKITNKFRKLIGLK